MFGNIGQLQHSTSPLYVLPNLRGDDPADPNLLHSIMSSFSAINKLSQDLSIRLRLGKRL